MRDSTIILLMLIATLVAMLVFSITVGMESPETLVGAILGATALEGLIRLNKRTE